MTNRTRGFYTLMGPALSRREIVAELGAPIWDDDGKTWFVALAGRSLAGFLAARAAKDGTHLSSVYIYPDHRGSGALRQLFDACVAEFPAPFTAVVPKSSTSAYQALGFDPIKETKNFQTMVRK